jgi:hypothetical protein
MQNDTEKSTHIAHYRTGLLADNTYTGNDYLLIIFVLQGKVKVSLYMGWIYEGE